MKPLTDKAILDQRRIVLEVEMRELSLRISILEQQMKQKRAEHNKVCNRLKFMIKKEQI